MFVTRLPRPEFCCAPRHSCVRACGRAMRRRRPGCRGAARRAGAAIVSVALGAPRPAAGIADAKAAANELAPRLVARRRRCLGTAAGVVGHGPEVSGCFHTIGGGAGACAAG